MAERRHVATSYTAGLLTEHDETFVWDDKKQDRDRERQRTSLHSKAKIGSTQIGFLPVAMPASCDLIVIKEAQEAWRTAFIIGDLPYWE